MRGPIASRQNTRVVTGQWFMGYAVVPCLADCTILSNALRSGGQNINWRRHLLCPNSFLSNGAYVFCFSDDGLVSPNNYLLYPSVNKGVASSDSGSSA
jgi:hypothetical protein